MILPATRPFGLHRVSTQELRRALQAVHRGDMRFPITRAGLIGAKFGHLENHLDALVGRDQASAVALLSAVLLERESRPGAGAGLVWAGPEVPGSGGREPIEVIDELIATARQSLLWTGIRAGTQHRVFRTLHAAMQGADLRCQLVLQVTGSGAGPQSQARTFLERNWHGRQPEPQVFTAGEAATTKGGLDLCGQCLIADEARVALFAGDPFASPDAAAGEVPYEGAIHPGLMIDDARFAKQLARQWQLLIEAGRLRQ